MAKSIWPTQLWAVLKKSFLLKLKSPKTSFFELVFPVAILLVLVLNKKDLGGDQVVQLLFNITLFLTFSITLSRLIFLVVTEREQRIAEMMKILGLPSWIFYSSWHIFYTFYMALVVSTIVPTLVYGEVYGKSSGVILWIFYFLYSTASISFSLFVSTPFNSAKVAQSVGFILYYAVAQIQHFQGFIGSLTAKSALAFAFPPLGLSFGMEVIANASSSKNNQNPGMRWDNVWDDSNNTNSLGHYIVLMAASTLVYYILYVYFDQVLPHAVGTRKPLLFFLNFSSLKKRACIEADERTALAPALHADDSAAAISIRGLTKRYASLSVPALADLDLNLASGELTVLLGRNGAGKTTLINILTGMTDPTSGAANVLGHAVPGEIDQVRHSLGFCPQHDIQWPQLTVMEHFRICGTLRGIEKSVIEERAKKLITTVGLAGKENAAVSTLSGGMKRKLSVGMAFIGDSKFVILDEPTSGLDPLSRRHMWDVLGKLREDRVILLSTHYMDEAEVLGDRVVILAEGVLRANGTVNELKRKFDCGYVISLGLVNSSAPPDEGAFIKSVETAIASVIGSDSVVAVSVQRDDHAKVGKKNLQISLPMDKSEYFHSLLVELRSKFAAQLDTSMLELVSKRLEEVFMKISLEGAVEGESEGMPAMEDSSDEEEGLAGKSTDSNKGADKVEYVDGQVGVGLMKSQITGTVVKRFRMLTREPKATLMQYLFPIIVILLGVVIQKDQENRWDAGSVNQESLSEKQADAMHSIFMIILLMIAYSSVGSGIVGALCREELTQSKFLQYVSGLWPSAYWTGTLVMDVAEYFLFTFGFTGLILFAVGLKTFIGPALLLLALYGPAVIVQTYFVVVLIPKQGLAKLISILLNTVIGIILPAAALALSGEKQQEEHHWIGPVSAFLRVFPSFNLGDGMLRIPVYNMLRPAVISMQIVLGPKQRDELAYVPACVFADNMYDYAVLGAPLLWMAAVIPVYFVASVWIDDMKYRLKFSRAGGITSPPISSGDNAAFVEDDSVVRERARVEAGDKRDVLRVVNASKQYVSHGPLSVDRVPLGVLKSGEICTILGENGAGKTSLIKMAIGEILPSQGDIYLNQFNSKTELKAFRHLIGYCPQFDAIAPMLTVKDHLRLYARIKGVSGSSVKLAANQVIGWLGLKAYANTKASALSGGYKRRLSLAIALMGQPSIVILDEPSCGMDPLARRQMWQVMEAASRRCSVVLTTHSMEEAEAVSTRLGIMSRGKMLCLGTSDELREKFSNGVEVFVYVPAVSADPEMVARLLASREPLLAFCQRFCPRRAARFLASGMALIGNSSQGADPEHTGPFAEWWAQETAVDQLEASLKSKLKGVESFEASGRSVRFVVAPADKTLTIDFVGGVFAALEDLKRSGSALDYSVTQNSLEQVFRSIASREKESDTLAVAQQMLE